jgi:hypothetical protein
LIKEILLNLKALEGLAFVVEDLFSIGIKVQPEVDEISTHVSKDLLLNTFSIGSFAESVIVCNLVEC